jgi:cytosine/adenosine deaminase-related metal-dependent hydrolase
MTSERTYHVEWFVTRQATFDVSVRIGDGQLLSVEAGHVEGAVDLGRVALVDGLVNAHTHLEFSRLTEPIPTAGKFTDWIRAVIKYRIAHPFEAIEAIRIGAAECRASGTTLVGDIATSGWTSDDYARAEFKGVVFQELLGVSPERIAQQLDLARSSTCDANGVVARGLSPHAPYSTHLELVRDSVTLSRQKGCPLAMHIAETPAEIELLANGSGEFRDLLTSLGLWRDGLFPGGQRPMDYLEILAEAPRSLIIHGNYLDDAELAFIAARPQMSLVYCPRTHAAFGHSAHSWQRLQDLGGRVAIGTDSRASNPDLSLFAELQFLAARHADVSHVRLLQAGSREGKRALGLDGRFGESTATFTLIRPGKSSGRRSEPELFAPDSHVAGTMIDGEWVWCDAGLKRLVVD